MSEKRVSLFAIRSAWQIVRPGMMANHQNEAFALAPTHLLNYYAPQTMPNEYNCTFWVFLNYISSINRGPSVYSSELLTLSSRWSANSPSKARALSRMPPIEMFPKTVAAYAKVITRALGIFCGRRSLSQSVGWPDDDAWVHESMQSPFNPCTATMLLGSEVSDLP
jgi:hypothetical protein